ncbi:helix-turn-helix domain-containing protein [Anaerotruncus rubiinfantis]|uniref:helix-turn-helix domain-containing protein n=1 Tax=Anaerotruncus rubiinfantis TaxID=1720200 RepID=UPI00189B6BE0
MAALAKKIGIPATKYWRYESGEREVTIHVLIKLVQFYNVRADYLLELSDRR